MNIFVVDYDPFVAARSLCDAHVIKMILESCQLLSTQDRLNGLTDNRYKLTHINHPCRKSLDNNFNYIWLQYHLYGLCKEYTYRYGKTHKSQELLEKYWLRSDSHDLYNGKLDFIENYSELLDLTTFACCSKEKKDYIANDICDVVKFYRDYYKYKKENLKYWKYTKRDEPSWLF